MFTPLPAQSVYEAQNKAKAATAALFLSLLLVYLICFELIAISGLFLLYPKVAFLLVGRVYWIVFLICSVFAWVHFAIAYRQPMEKITNVLGAYPADPTDRYHQSFIRFVREAEAATGIHMIRALIIPSPALNAFSLIDCYGHSAIGVTEAILTTLSGPELSAVIAHEAAHLAHKDARVVGIACSLFGIFDAVDCALFSGDSPHKKRQWLRGFRVKGSGAIVIFYLIVLLLIKISRLFTRILAMAISRNREFMADAAGVHMCKDPLSMASALNKISRAPKVLLPQGSTFNSMFIFNPKLSSLDEAKGVIADMFSTHPPLYERLQKCLQWARADMSALNKKNEPDTTSIAPQLSADASQYFVHAEGSWRGPFDPESLKTYSGLTPLSWVAGSEGIFPASRFDFLHSVLFGHVSEMDTHKEGQSPTKLLCPRCHLRLTPQLYEGLEIFSCSGCKGHLLPRKYLDRLVLRKQLVFSKKQEEEAHYWRKQQEGPLGKLLQFEPIHCPLCDKWMSQVFYSEITRVIVDRCQNKDCGAHWCDEAEIEKIQILAKPVA